MLSLVKEPEWKICTHLDTLEAIISNTTQRDFLLGTFWIENWNGQLKPGLSEEEGEKSAKSWLPCLRECVRTLSVNMNTAGGFICFCGGFREEVVGKDAGIGHRSRAEALRAGNRDDS